MRWLPVIGPIFTREDRFENIYELNSMGSFKFDELKQKSTACHTFLFWALAYCYFCNSSVSVTLIDEGS